MSVSTKMIIPRTITVGYQERSDTYTKRLAYVIYTDAKGVLRKEKSWQHWRKKDLGQDVYDNTPRTGFVLNRKAGGYSSGWNHRNTYIRVFDPNGFEFEISVPNLLFILQETSSIQGKGLEGEFVYAWDGTELVLLPTCSQEYKACVQFTEAQTQKIDKKDMVEGAVYRMKDMTEVMYLGKHDFCERPYWSEDRIKPLGRMHIFAKMKPDKYEQYIPQTGFTKLAAKIEDFNPDYADRFDQFKSSKFSDKVVEVKLLPAVLTDVADRYSRGKVLVLKEGDNRYCLCRVFHNHYRFGNQDLRFLRGPQVDLSLKQGYISFPKAPEFPYSSYDRTGDSALGREFFSVQLKTQNGLSYDATGDIY